MLTFRTITMKNFLSIGDNPVTIRLDKSPTTLVSGKNGVGKTTIMTDSLCFALFGRAFRDIKKHRLINTVNQRDCTVELVFDIGVNQYKIIRGLKPNIFEVYVNGNKLNEAANVKDMQRYLEDSIIKFDYSVFSRVVVMSSMNYTPFLNLNTHERRKFVESILSLVVFSEMNNLHRQNVSHIKQEIGTKNHELELLRTKIDSKNQIYNYITNKPKNSTNVHFVKVLLQDIETEKQKLADVTEKLKQVPNTAELSDELRALDSNISELRNEIHHIEIMITEIDNKLAYLEKNSACVKCDQDITDEYKHHMSLELGHDRSQYEDTLEEKNVEYTRLTGLREKLSNKIDVINSTRRTLENAICNYSNNISLMVKQAKGLTEISTNSNELSESEKEAIRQEIATLSTEYSLVETGLEDLKSTEDMYNTVSLLLKDEGIKLEIIRQYIPILISNTNYYLSKMNIPLKFHIDELFNDTIIARYSDELEYNSLSAGERARVDIALNLAWIKTAKTKGGINTNLLVLDEIADNSLDQIGTAAMMDIINNELGQTMNIFIISHKANLDENVRSVLTLEKVNGFTRIV